MRPSVDWHVLARYLADECSPVEAQAVEAWIEADPSRRQLIDELESIWDASSDRASLPAHAIDLEADWDRLSEAMQAADAREVAPQRFRPATDRSARRPGRRRRAGTPSTLNVLYILAAGVVLMGSIWLGVRLWGSSAPETVFREVVAERGERANVQLIDGTEVTLNVDSRLRIPTAFGGGQRAVHLEGEAYFNVATDSTRPFLVYTRDAVVDVRGTAFNIRSYPEDQRVQVAVVEGAVSLRPQRAASSHGSARLEPGQIGHIAAQEAHVTTEAADSVASLLGWMEGRLIFENERLSDVAARLERWYDLRFKIVDPALDSLHLTASLKSRSVENVLDVITASLGIQYHIHENTVVLSDDARPVRSYETK